MPLDKSKCRIPKTWCGTGKKPKGYDKVGSPYECLRTGVGAGIHTEKLKTLPVNSVQRIRFVGEKMEKKMKNFKVGNITDLVKKTKSMSVTEIESFLKKVLKRSDGSLDGRAYNSVILYLDSKGVTTPQCKQLF